MEKVELNRLMGVSTDSKSAPDAWHVRIEPEHGNHQQGGGEALESIGRVLGRGRDGRPTQAIGLLKDLSLLRKAEEALLALGYQKARLKDLQAKLNPHFLFNSLNIIRALIHSDVDKADDAITSLASLLRNNLRTTDRSLIALEEEMKNIRALLHLAQLRFGERLRTAIDIPELLKETPVPPMMLLNLVENAITHGIGNLEEGGVISVQAKAFPEHVGIIVRNSGTLPETPGRGLGIGDALQRLELLFGGRAKFSLSQENESTVSAEIWLPALVPPLR